MRQPEKICRYFREAIRLFRWKGYVCFPSLLALAAVASCSGWDSQQIRTESDHRLILFSFSGKAKTVCLSGDFNYWSADSNCLKQEGERWKILVLLPSGRYRYCFLLDGKDWVPDPGALLQEEDGLGKKNSVLVIE
jgi:1,4-alpha-glucan branching enzyme